MSYTQLLYHAVVRTYKSEHTLPTDERRKFLYQEIWGIAKNGRATERVIPNCPENFLGCCIAENRTEIAQLKITNLPGAPVYETKTLSSPEIQWQHATDGLYFVVIILKDGTLLTQKMMVQK